MKKLVFQSTVKPYEEANSREDRIKVDHENGLYAIADGAGGVGLFAGEWAEYLLENLPLTPFISKLEFVKWHRDIKEKYIRDRRRYVIEERPDLLLKFENEGSLSTLLVLWHNKKDNTMSYLSYGDSVLFVFTRKYWSSMKSYADFLQRPYLISCYHAPAEEHIDLDSIPISKGAKYVLCSDTLSQYLMASYYFTSDIEEHKDVLNIIEADYETLSQYTIDLRKKGFEQKNFTNDIIKPLLQAGKNELSFKEYLYKLYDEGVLGYDDYSLIKL
jgi:serine/threonine protein phosphatase PrpC